MPDCESFTSAEAGAVRLRQIRGLLDVAFGGDFSDQDWDHTLGGDHVIVEDDGVLVAHAAVVGRVLEIDGAAWNTGYVEGVATLPGRQGKGFGALTMTEAMTLLRRRYALGALSSELHAFYERLGWERWQGPTFVRRSDGELVRTAEEDDGVMVLRFGASADVDMTSAIACGARAGDDW